jgi:hypothetical protein
VPVGAIWRYYQEGDEIPRHEDTGEPIYEVLSGNHRVKAAIAAGLKEIDFKVTDDPVSEKRRIAIQLSHNAIFGEDDPAILKMLYEKLDDTDLRAYSGLDDRTLELLQEVDVSSLSEANLQFQVITFAFLPEEIEAVKAVWEDVRALAQGDELWLARWSDYDAFMDTMEATSSSYNILNAATTLLILLEIVSRHLPDLADGWYDHGMIRHKGHVPISSVIGATKAPAEVLAPLKALADRLVAQGEIEANKRWQVLTHLLDHYSRTQSQPEAEAGQG